MLENQPTPSEENKKPESIDKIQLRKLSQVPEDGEATQEFFNERAQRKEADYKRDNPDEEKTITKLLLTVGEEPEGEIWSLEEGTWKRTGTVPLTK